MQVTRSAGVGPTSSRPPRRLTDRMSKKKPAPKQPADAGPKETACTGRCMSGRSQNVAECRAARRSTSPDDHRILTKYASLAGLYQNLPRNSEPCVAGRWRCPVLRWRHRGTFLALWEDIGGIEPPLSQAPTCAPITRISPPTPGYSFASVNTTWRVTERSKQ